MAVRNAHGLMNIVLRTTLPPAALADMATLTTATGTMAVVALVACWLPAWRAARLDSNLVLRDSWLYESSRLFSIA